MRKYFLGMSLSRKGAATATSRRFNKKSNRMNAFKRNAGKVLLGVSIAAGAAYATAGSIQEARAAEKSKLAGELVGHFGNNDWRVINPNGESTEWECSAPGTLCTGIVKEGEEPDSEGRYTDSQIDFTPTSAGFQPL